MKVMVTPLTSAPVAARPVEIVERKGTGHPDTICDALAEELSIALSKFYLERCGLILHHNVDKALLWGGAARAGFGGGEVLQPIEIYSRRTRDARIPRHRGAARGNRGRVDAALAEEQPAGARRRAPCAHPLPAAARVPPTLVDLFLRQRESGVVLANDTSCGVGYAPLDALESMVLRVERHLNSAAARSACPAIGEDIKVMGVRPARRSISPSPAPSSRRHVDGHGRVPANKARVRRARARGGAHDHATAPVDVLVNAADGDTADSVYLTVTGTSAEAGDDGEVGRGNRVNGLITPYRPMTHGGGGRQEPGEPRRQALSTWLRGGSRTSSSPRLRRSPRRNACW